MEKRNKALKFWMSVFYTILLAALIISFDLLIALAVAAVAAGFLYIIFEMITAPLKPPDYGLSHFEKEIYDMERKKLK